MSCSCIGGTCSGGSCGGYYGIGCSSNLHCGDMGGGGYGGGTNDGMSPDTGIGCFVKGTLITIADGTQRKIEDLDQDEKVLSYNMETNEVEEDIILQIDTPFRSGLVTIKTEHSQNTNTFDHPYWSVTKTKWVSYAPGETEENYKLNDVWELEEGEILLYLDENGNIIESKVLSITEEESTESCMTYNLSNVKKNHNFFANGILVHNKGQIDAEPIKAREYAPILKRRGGPSSTNYTDGNYYNTSRKNHDGRDLCPDGQVMRGGICRDSNDTGGGLMDPHGPCGCLGHGQQGSGILGNCQGNCSNEGASCGWKQSWSSSGNTYHWYFDGCNSNNAPPPPSPPPPPGAIERKYTFQGGSKNRAGGRPIRKPIRKYRSGGFQGPGSGLPGTKKYNVGPVTDPDPPCCQNPGYWTCDALSYNFTNFCTAGAVPYPSWAQHFCTHEAAGTNQVAPYQGQCRCAGGASDCMGGGPGGGSWGSHIGPDSGGEPAGPDKHYPPIIKIARRGGRTRRR